MTEQEDIEAAKLVAQAFFDEMLAWEQWSPSNAQQDDARGKSLAKLKPIFEKYLSKKALQHDQSRYEYLDYGQPPEFSEEIARAELAGKDKVWIYVPFGLSGGFARYLVKKEGGQWKIDAKESDIANKGVWKKRPDL